MKPFAQAFETRQLTDPLVPGQEPTHSTESGERLLAFAVLQDAVECYQKWQSNVTNGRRTTRIGMEAAEWLFSDHEYPYSFVWLCYFLGLEPDYVRTLIQAGRPVSYVRKRRRAGARRSVFAGGHDEDQEAAA